MTLAIKEGKNVTESLDVRSWVLGRRHSGWFCLGAEAGTLAPLRSPTLDLGVRANLQVVQYDSTAASQADAQLAMIKVRKS